MLKPFLTAHWRYLAMLNFRVAPEILAPCLPAGTELDFFRVEHPRWKIWPATSYEIRADVAALYGDKFLAPLTASPPSAFIADGGEKSSARVSDAVNLAKITQLPALNSQL